MSRTISNIEGVIAVEQAPAVVPDINALIRSLVDNGVVTADEVSVDGAAPVAPTAQPVAAAAPKARKKTSSVATTVTPEAPVKAEEPPKNIVEPPTPFVRHIDTTIFDHGTVEFTPQFRVQSPTRIVIVGCGGTGSRIVPLLAQHVANHNEAVLNGQRAFLRTTMEMILIDMDTVELKNLKRQNFFKFDIGKNKAHALAERFSALYGIDILAMGCKFDEAKERLMENAPSFNYIIFDCTDNAVARKSIENCDLNSVLISCGNEDTFGQVLISTTTQRRYRTRALMDILKQSEGLLKAPCPGVHTKVQHLPTLLELYKNFKDSGTASCAEIAVDEQSMPVNSLVAQLAYNVFYDITGGRTLNYHMVRCNVNNTYSTNYVNNPFELRKLFMRSLFGVCTDAAVKANEEIQKEFNNIMRARYTEFVTYIDKYGVYMLPYIQVYLENSYYITSAEQVELNKKSEALAEEILKLAA